MKKILIPTLLLVLLITACGKGTNKPNNTTEIKENTTAENTATETKSPESVTIRDFFPIENDVYLKYKGTGNEYAEHEIYIDYIKDNIVQIRNINPGTTSVFVYQYKDGELKKVFMRGETYYHYDYTDVRGKDEVLIKEPIKVGTTWTLADGTSRSITAVDKDMTTPAGTYKALEITTVGSDWTTRDYYAIGTGHVKSEFISDGNTENPISSELEKLEKNVPYKDKIKFYFPDFNNDRIVYEERVVEIKTNQGILSLLENQLKIAPKEDKLKGTLTANVNILGVKIDDEKGIVTVDFSPQLVSEMNAGSAYESMIINSIVNTFGDYFQKDKVIITIEGKPYSSGHIFMKEGEYFKVTKEKAVKLES